MSSRLIIGLSLLVLIAAGTFQALVVCGTGTIDPDPGAATFDYTISPENAEYDLQVDVPVPTLNVGIVVENTGISPLLNITVSYSTYSRSIDMLSPGDKETLDFQLEFSYLSGAASSSGDRYNFKAVAPTLEGNKERHTDVIINIAQYFGMDVGNITSPSGNPEAGTPVIFTFDIFNSGNGATSVRVELYVDGKYNMNSSIGNLVPGMNSNKEFSWIAREGSHKLKLVFIDVGSEISGAPIEISSPEYSVDIKGDTTSSAMTVILVIVIVSAVVVVAGAVYYFKFFKKKEIT